MVTFRALLGGFLGALLGSGGLVLLAVDIAGFGGWADAAPYLVADLLLVGTGLLARWLVIRGWNEGPNLALVALVAGCLGAVALTGRWWLGAGAGLMCAVFAPQFVAPRRAAWWLGCAMLLCVPTALVSGVVAAGGVAVFVLGAGLGSLRLARDFRRSGSRATIALEQSLDTERHRVAQLSAQLARYEGKPVRRRTVLRGALSRRLGVIEAVAQALARDLESALGHAGAVPLERAARRAQLWAAHLARVAGGGVAREQQTTLSQIWPRVQALSAEGVLASHTLTTDLPAHLPPVVGSGEQWAQILTALVENALEAMPGGGPVAVRQEAGRREGFGLVVVSDRGRGMNAEQIAQVMRLEPGRFEGTRGVGLAMVISIVEGLGGDITIESVVGEGTKVELDVPIVVPTLPAGDEDAILQLEGRVLLADDDELTRMSIARMLESLGLETIQVDSGTGARSRLLADGPGAFRAAVLDVVMPGTPVEEIVVAVREQVPGFPVLVVSGFDTMQSVDAVLALGGVRFLRKPFTRGDLYRALRDLFSAEPVAAA